MKYCVSTDVGTWTNWLTFEPDPDYSPDAGTGLLSPLSYKPCYAQFYVGKIRRIRTYWSLQQGMVLTWFTVRSTAAATRGFAMVLFTASRRNNFVGGTCALPSVLLVQYGDHPTRPNGRWRDNCIARSNMATFSNSFSKKLALPLNL